MGEENKTNSIKTNDEELMIDKPPLKIKIKLPTKPDPDQKPDEIKFKLPTKPDPDQELNEMEEGEIRPEPEPKPEHETPPPQQEEEEEKPQQPPPAGGGVVCPHCNREFGNGKALGGHMRVHTDKLKTNHQSPNPNPNPSPKGGAAAGVGAEPITCDICHKEFKSQKSLFGHMRSHPERKWRGMQPPTEGPNPAPKSDPGSGQVVVMGSSPDLRWGMKGIRGHKGVWEGSGSSSPASERMVKEDEAAWTLLALSAGVSCFDPSERSSSASFDEDELYFLQNSTGVSEKKPEDPEKDPKAGKGKGKKRVRVQEGSDDPIEEKKPGFDCLACNKTFSTYQALGGHMSSHSHKEKMSSQGQIVDGSGSGSGSGSGLTSDVKMGTGMGMGTGTGGGGGGDHKDKGKICKICHRMFPTGQALGGHQRCHYVPESVEPDPSSPCLPESIEPDPSTPGLPEPDPPSSPSPSGSQREGQVVERVGFDLNVAAVEEEGEGGGGGGAAAVDSELEPPPAL